MPKDDPVTGYLANNKPTVGPDQRDLQVNLSKGDDIKGERKLAKKIDKMIEDAVEHPS